ncbi:MAG TPA: alcohol dehydrogenase catalytic domain-containing protein [Bryobacteraceae bacterium]|nr:alcohol dehydrogenase catalytic domain-containing protein [Bryobacteraceae bacterium]
MQALVKTQKGVGFLELKEMPAPKPAPGEVLIEVKACGICGTDVHVLHDKFPYWPPVILGHEFAGIVVEANATQHYKVGDRVVGEPHTQACGHCYLCRTGNIQICPTKRSPGWGIDGAFTKYLKMPERLLHRIPEGMGYDVAAVVEPTANTVHDVIERAKVEAGDFVVVLGPGPIGLLAAMAARAGGARHIVMIGAPPDEAVRLKKARELGFQTVINLANTNPVEAVMQLTGGVGADLVIEASGAPPAIASTVDLVRKKGRICAIGLTGKDNIVFPWDKAAFKVCDIIFNLSTSYTSWDRTINLIAGGLIPAGEVISHRLPLSQWRTAFDEIEAQRALKVILIPD